MEKHDVVVVDMKPIVYNKQILLNIDEQRYKKLDQLRKEHGIPIAFTIRKAIDYYFEKSHGTKK